MGQLLFTMPVPESGELLLKNGSAFSRQTFDQVVSANPDLRIERTAEGEISVMAPAHSRTGFRNLSLAASLKIWADANGEGIAFDSSTGYDLPNGANRSPDASWVRRARLRALTPEQLDGYFPLCPDFVVELRSQSDRLSTLKIKMEEYISNGASLGWLIDPASRTVFVYRPGVEPQELLAADSVSGDPELPGFRLGLAEIWDPGF